MCIDTNYNALGYAGLAVFIGSYLWGVVDAWVTPHQINRKYRKIKKMLGEPLDDEDASFGVIPIAASGINSGYGIGLAYRF